MEPRGKKNGLNFLNVTQFGESTRHQGEGSGLGQAVEALLVAGGRNQRAVRESEVLQQQLPPTRVSLVRLEGVADVLEEAPARLAESFILFSQGLGLIPTARRRSSRIVITGPDGDQETPNR